MANELICQVEPTDFYYSTYEAVAGVELARRGLRHTFEARFHCPERFPEQIAGRKLIASQSDSKGKPTEELREWENGLISISVKRSTGEEKQLSVCGYFGSRGEARQCLSEMKRLLPPETDRSCTDTATISFWNATLERSEYRPNHETQTMSVPGWQQISANYPAAVRTELGRVMAIRARCEAGPRLMLWRGLPGTGKTWAIRALAREWANWCNLHYVIDPSVFFSNGNYMLKLLSKLRDLDEGEEDMEPKWNLLLLEDAGEFITMDSRQQYGQALAKLLNLTDGLFGQGLRLLVLITTNEELRNLHPAIIRNGRCLSNLEFPEFTPDEAREWLRGHTGEMRAAPARRTLSDLYAAAHHQTAVANSAPPRAAAAK